MGIGSVFHKVAHFGSGLANNFKYNVTHPVQLAKALEHPRDIIQRSSDYWQYEWNHPDGEKANVHINKNPKFDPNAAEKNPFFPYEHAGDSNRCTATYTPMYPSTSSANQPYFPRKVHHHDKGTSNIDTHRATDHPRVSPNLKLNHETVTQKGGRMHAKVD